MNYSALDIKNVQIKKSMYGYNEDQVNEILDNIHDDYNAFSRENAELKDKLSVLSDGIKHYKAMEESLQNTLIIAQQTAEEVRKNSMERASNIIREAELKAEKITQEANQNLANLKKEYEELKKKITSFKIQYENVLNTELNVLKQLDLDE